MRGARLQAVDELPAVVYCSWGMWVADCPNRPMGCLGAEHFGHAPVTGHVGGLTLEGFRCNRCGQLAPARWPDNVRDLWAVLQERPLPETRNWSPGETIEDLVRENLEHGVIPPALLRGEQVRTYDDRLLGGPPALTAGSPRPIGGV